MPVMDTIVTVLDQIQKRNQCFGQKIGMDGKYQEIFVDEYLIDALLHLYPLYLLLVLHLPLN